MSEPPDRLLPGGLGIAMTRVFDASPEDVWKEWTLPGAFADWFGGPGSEVPLESVSMDVRPGGTWQLTMFTGDGGRRIDWRGEYVEVDPPHRLVFTITDIPDDPRREVITVVLVDLGEGRTEMRFEQRGTDRRDYDRTMHGWSGFFDRIAERLAASSAR